jgi:DNA-binding transcriptional LysR family regulator
LLRFLTRYPDLSIDLDERTSAGMVPALAEGRADLGVVADIADLTSLQTHLIAQDQLVVVASRAHRVGAAASVAFADILDEDFVGLSDAALETHLAERASRLGRQLHYRIHMRGIEHVAAMVESGVGIAILSHAYSDMLRRPGLAIVPLAEPWAARRLYLCARDFAALTPHAQLLADQLLGRAASET